MYDYLNDEYGKICLDMTRQCKTDVGFGAVLVKNYKILGFKSIIGIGRNRLSNLTDRYYIPRVDYAIHAEQASIMDALMHGLDPTNGEVYVLGMCLSGKNKGKLTTRTEDVFICSKCPHVFIKYNIKVFIPHVEGWHSIEPEKALEIGKKLANKGYWKEFVTGEI
jgi:hypothetical protein